MAQTQFLVIPYLLVLVTSEILDEAPFLQSVPPEIILTANLTKEQERLLPEIRWSAPSSLHLQQRVNSGIPDGVKCETAEWCDAMSCTQVCKKGTVQLEPWFKKAMKHQVSLSRKLPLCYAQWLGTHNSGITLADGFGNRDPYYSELLRMTTWFEYQSEFRTNNQWFSITDQLNMGVRLVELDVHWVKDALRIAHCGGITNKILHYISSLINLVATLIGSPFRWDEKTLGCFPSGSSIAALDQRRLIEAMNEIAAWLNEEENLEEFLMIYIDDQRDLAEWGLLEELRNELSAAIGLDKIFTPGDLIRLGLDMSSLPSADELVKIGKRVMFLSRTYYRDLGSSLFLFYTENWRLCDWKEEDLASLYSLSSDIQHSDCGTESKTMTGQLLRLADCRLRYGPYSCRMHLTDNEVNWTEERLRNALSCGYNFPSLDGLTPSLAESAIWSWAPGHPLLFSDEEAIYVVVDVRDGRWRSAKRSDIEHVPVACRNNDSAILYDWKLCYTTVGQPDCMPFFVTGVPRNGKENHNLQMLIKESGIAKARIVLDPSSLQKY